MSAATEIDGPDEDASTPKKWGKLPLIIGLVLALIGAGGGFFLTQMGLFPFDSQAELSQDDPADRQQIVTEEVSFVRLDPINVTLPPGSERSLLRLQLQLDVAPQNQDAVEAIKPRIVDILNTYLRAIEISDLESPTALLWLRSQMLHRVQVVAGPGVVRDLLVTEFILN